MVRIVHCCCALAAGLAAMPLGVAAAHEPKTGGATALTRPEVTQLRCNTGDEKACTEGEPLKIAGENLAGTEKIVFLGGAGGRDDRRARPIAASPHRVLVRVPAAARTGRVRVIASHAASSGGPRLRVLAKAPPPAPPTPVDAPSGAGVFPVQGEHEFGTATNAFGGPRNHKGQDIFARCGTPIVVALSGVVTLAKFHDRAGNYAVVKADDGTSQAYMHMQSPALVQHRQRVAAGQALGKVGDTGRATGCHLHFELWTAPGWYEGGKAVDPLAALSGWDVAKG